MAELTRDETRYYHTPGLEDYPVAAGVTIYEGSAVGCTVPGYARPLVGGDQFIGFAAAKTDNAGGISGAVRVKIKTSGFVRLNVDRAYVSSNNRVAVYASNDNTFTLAKSGNSKIGVVSRWDGNLALVHYDINTSIDNDLKPVRSSPVKIALFGDSTATSGTYTSNDNCEVIDLAFPASGTTSSSVTSTRYITYLNYPSIMLARNAGIGGQTTTDMLARDNLVASATRKAATDIANAGIDCIIFRGGSINNFAEGIYTQQDIDARVALHIQVLARLRASGAAIIDEGIAGYLTAAGTTAQMGKLAAIQIFNAAIASHIKSLNDPLVVFMDPVGITCDSTGIWLTGYSSDGVHPEIPGQIAISEAEKIILTALFGPSANIRYPGTNLATNPMLSATGADGAGRGTVATGFTIPANNAWRVFSDLTVETIEGLPVQSMKVAWTGGGITSATISLPIDLTAMNPVSGDVFGMEFWCWIRKVDGTPLPVGSTISSKFSVKKVANGTVANVPLSMTTYGGMQELKGHVVFNKIKINDDLANLETPIFNLLYSPASPAGIQPSESILISIGGVRIVKQ